MNIINKISDIKLAIKEARSQNKKIILIPTMGALHQGHLSLIKEAKKYGDFIITTIFVNKTQFNNQKDFEKYPRNIDSDIKKLQNLEIDILFTPLDDEIFQMTPEIPTKSSHLEKSLCATTRPGHFDGVRLIISKFLDIINPDFMILGQKDFQQFLIIKKLVQDLKFNTKIIASKSIREDSGLVLSSRNQRLSQEDKNIAINIFRILQEIKEQSKIVENLEDLLENKKQELLDLGFEKIDYLEIRQEDNLELARKIEIEKKYRIFIAVYLNQVRLIDNLQI